MPGPELLGAGFAGELVRRRHVVELSNALQSVIRNLRNPAAAEKIKQIELLKQLSFAIRGAVGVTSSGPSTMKRPTAAPRQRSNLWNWASKSRMAPEGEAKLERSTRNRRSQSVRIDVGVAGAHEVAEVIATPVVELHRPASAAVDSANHPHNAIVQTSKTVRQEVSKPIAQPAWL